jgi:C4-dicarboxylate transporter DctQ subunit
MNGLQRPARLIYAGVRLLTDAAMAVAAASILLSLALVCYSVGARYFFNNPAPWVDEAVGYVLTASVMFAIAEALRKGEHICVDILTEKLSARAQRAVYVAGMIAVALTAGALLLEGWETVAFSKMLGIRSIGYLDAPIWIPQIMIPVGGALLLLASLAELLRVAAGLPPDEQTGSSAEAPKATGVD